MGIRRIFLTILAVVMIASTVIPVCGEDANPYNVLYGADIEYVGLDEPHYRGEVYQDIYHLVDNQWAMGPKSEQGNYAAKIVSAEKVRYNINGRKTSSGSYAAIITFILPEAATVSGFRLIHPDVTGAPGANDPLDFLLTHFDVLGSDSGASGTWKVLYEARDLRNGQEIEYHCEGVGFGSNGIPFYSYEGKFEETHVTHIALAIHALNVETNIYGKHMNIHEFQAFTPEYYTKAEDTEPVTDTSPVIVETKAPLTLSDFLPKSPLAIVAVSAVLATVCAAACVLHESKKEKKR